VATKIKAKKKAQDILDAPVKTNDFQKFIAKFKENMVLYCAVGGFIIVCVIAGLAFKGASATSNEKAMTKFAQAMGSEDAALRVTELEPLTKGSNAMTAEAAYMMGEAAFEAKQYDKAKEAFEIVRGKFAGSSFAADAVEGLGTIAEDAKQYDDAIASYKEIIEKWPQSFTKRRQQMNIARCQEAAGRAKEAVDAYKAQVDEFPGSELEKEAKAALDRLRVSNPDLFPKEEPAKDEKAADKPADKPADSAAAPAATPVPAAEAPAPDAAVPVAAPETPAPAPAPAPEAPAPAEQPK
jgi:tetratricopeptide (TPR) repeat protein